MELNMLTIFAIVAAMGLVEVVAVTITSIPENAEARGCAFSGHLYNASDGRCFHP
jgi:hypothetical protein